MSRGDPRVWWGNWSVQMNGLQKTWCLWMGSIWLWAAFAGHTRCWDICIIYYMNAYCCVLLLSVVTRLCKAQLSRCKNIGLSHERWTASWLAVCSVQCLWVSALVTIMGEKRVLLLICGNMFNDRADYCLHRRQFWVATNSLVARASSHECFACRFLLHPSPPVLGITGKTKGYMF